MNETPNFSVGDVVSLKYHPYSVLKETHDTIISGDPLSIPPLFSISEIVKENIDKFDPQTGLQKHSGFKCKCIWYSHLKGTFEEKWIPSNFLKLISRVDYNQEKSYEELAKDLHDKQISLNTYKIEGSKQKSSSQYKFNSSHSPIENKFGPANSTINAFLAFLPPIMLTKDVIVNPSQESIYSKSTNEQIRWKSKYKAKCLWFNNISNKMSEIEIPCECLYVVESEAVDKDLIDSINAKEYRLMDLNGEQHIVRLDGVRYQDGVNFIRAFDYMINSLRDLRIEDYRKSSSLDHYKNSVAPLYKDNDEIKNSFEEFEESQKMGIINNAIEGRKYLRIHYMNRNQESSIRTLKENVLISLRVGDEGQKYFFLEGYCLLKKEIRTFQVKRISKIEELKAKY